MNRVFFCLSIWAIALNAIAQQPEMLDTVIVSASHGQTSLRSSNRNVIVLQGEEIENAPVQSVSEILDFATGIDARQRGTYGTQTDLSIRGGTFEQVLVLINGIRISDPQTGHHLMNLPVQKADIERIEILMGGGSYIFGGSAYSGAVNIITKKAKEDALSLHASGGSFGSYSLGTSQALTGKNSTTTLSASQTASDGFKANTDYSIGNFFAQTNIDFEKSRLNLTAGYTQQGFGAQGFYSDAYPEQYERTKTIFANIGYTSGDKIEISRQVYWRRNYDEFQLYREGEDFYRYENGFFIKGDDTAASFYKGHNYHRTDVTGGRVEARFSSVWGYTSAGVEYRFENIVSNNLGEPLQGAIDIPGKRGAYTLGSSRHNVSAALEQSKKLRKWDLSLALLINYNSDYHTDLYPAATAGYNLGKFSKIYGSFNRSFRLPSYTDLYYNLGGAVGSIHLQPEHSLNYEAGYKYMRKKWFMNVSFFRREGKNTIDWIKECSSCELRATNTSVVNFNGGEFTLRHSPERFGVDYLEFGYSHLFTDQPAIAYESLYVFDYLKNKLTLRAQHSLFRNFKWSYSLSYQDRNGKFTSAADGQTRNYPDVFLINTRISYRYKMLEAYVSAQNLLNKTYYDRGNIELPGLWMWSGISIRL